MASLLSKLYQNSRLDSYLFEPQQTRHSFPSTPYSPQPVSFLVYRAALLPMRAPPASVYTSDNPVDLFRTFQVRIASLVCSGVSMATSLVALYWFCRMEKRFRHQLIVLLFYGGLVSSTWYFVFAVLTTINGMVSSESISCQVSGFFIQYGTETCDYAVLVIAIHSAMQVFNPYPPATSDGLRPYRYYIYAGALLIPAIMAGLAFCHPEYRYQFLGAFCMLPIRPFWYRLALQWIPRYLIAFIIFGLAIAIYSYVGLKFRSYNQLSQSIRDSQMTSHLSSSRSDRELEVPTSPRAPKMTEEPGKLRRTPLTSQGANHDRRRGSAVSFTYAGSAADNTASATPTRTYSVLEEVTSLAPRRPSLALIPSGYTIHQTSPPGTGYFIVRTRPNISERISTSTNTSVPTSPSTNQDPDPLSLTLSPIIQPRHSSPGYIGKRQMDRQRARCHRQLRLLFIYPIVYTIMWLFPFVMHCMNYQERYALNPIWIVRLGSNIFVTSIGFANFVVFTVREKPWKSIPSSDGTVWGSFAVWRSTAAAEPDAEERVQSTGSRTGRFSFQRTVSESAKSAVGVGLGIGEAARSGRIGARTGGSTTDNTRRELQLARVRLALEREERLQALQVRSGIASAGGREDETSSLSGEEDGWQDGGAEGLSEGGGSGEMGMGMAKAKGKGKGKARDDESGV